MARECPTPALALNQPRGYQGNVAHPLPVTVPKPAIGSLHSHPDLRPRLAIMKMAQQTSMWEVTPAVPFLNLYPIAHLVGWSNEVPLIVDRQKVTALIDSGAQVSSISSGFCEQMALMVHPIDQLVELEGTGGSAIPYLEYVEVNIQIPGIWGYLPFGHTNYNLFQEGTSCDGVQGNWQGHGNDYERGTSKGNHDLEIGPLWCSYVWVAPVALQRHRGLGVLKGGYSLCSPQPYCAQGILSRWHPGTCPYDMEGHHPSIQDHKYSWQDRCLRVLYVGPFAGWTSTRLPIAPLHCTDCHMWRVTPKFLLGAFFVWGNWEPTPL